MDKITRWLVGALVIQVLLSLYLSLHTSRLEAFTPNEPLLGLDRNAVDKIVLTQSDKSSLAIKKQDGKWILPDHFNFPAQANKVEQFVASVADLKKSLPVAQTEIAARQLNLGADNFDRKIEFFKDDKALQTLLLGSSPGFKKIHARAGNGSTSYSIDFSSHEASARPVDWYDKNLLKLDAKEIAKIELPGYTLTEEDGKLAVANLSAGKETKRTETDDIVSRITDLTFQDVLGTENKPEFQQQSPLLTVTVEPKTGEKKVYTFSAPKEGDYYVLKVSTAPYYFSVPKAGADKIKSTTVEQLIGEKSTATPGAAAAEQAAVPAGGNPAENKAADGE